VSTTLTIETERNVVTVENNVFDVTTEVTKNVVEVNPSTSIVAVDQTTYTHDQSIPSATWTIAHNLGRYPSVTVVTSAGDTVLGSVRYDSADQITLTFAGAFAGKAHLN